MGGLLSLIGVALYVLFRALMLESLVCFVSPLIWCPESCYVPASVGYTPPSYGGWKVVVTSLLPAHF